MFQIVPDKKIEFAHWTTKKSENLSNKLFPRQTSLKNISFFYDKYAKKC